MCESLDRSATTTTTRPQDKAYLWLVGNGRIVVIVVLIVPHSSIPYYPKVRRAVPIPEPLLGGFWGLPRPPPCPFPKPGFRGLQCPIHGSSALCGWFSKLGSLFGSLIREFPKIRGTGVPYFGVLIMRILPFRVLYQVALFSETPPYNAAPYYLGYPKRRP